MKIDCDCRKPKPGMLLQAAEKYNIDLKKSYMVGDSYRDVEAGLAAGVRCIYLGRPDSEHDFLAKAEQYDSLKAFVDDKI